MEVLDNLYGRVLTQAQLPEKVSDFAIKKCAFTMVSGRYKCWRCASLIDPTWQLPNKAYYCRACLVFGRLTSKDDLYYFKQKPFPKNDVLTWSGRLTPYQQAISDSLVKGYEAKQQLLVHAVTGAGKTEMIYAVVAKVINQGGAVALASPRIDVCLELSKRFEKDFSCSISLLYGGSESYHRSPLVIATTHQLLTFYRAFDLVIIDEVDAFPFVDNPQLYHGVEQATKKDGIKIFLTATSTKQLEQQVRRGELQKLDLARRFHANPLVVPKPIWLKSVVQQVKRQKLPAKLITIIKKQRKTGFPLLLFFPNIEQGQAFTLCLQNYFPTERIAFVASVTEDRLEKVQDFREGKTSILVSTTILERGVTFPCVDVFVMEANHHLFTRSSLVQISGRVGRAKERPTGQLLFFHDGLTTAIAQAIAEIKEMNHKGGFA